MSEKKNCGCGCMLKDAKKEIENKETEKKDK